MLRYVLRLPSELPRFSILRKSFFTSSINFGGGPRPPKNKRLRNGANFDLGLIYFISYLTCGRVQLRNRQDIV